MSVKLLTSLILLALIVGTNARDTFLTWEVGYVDTNPDGLAVKKAVGVNGIWPPPAIVSRVGDLLHLTVKNNIEFAITIHNHGFSFPNSTFYDGAKWVSQCGIPPGKTFLYKVPIVDDVGTYWIHGHADGQTIDGLRAPHIILPTEDVKVPYQAEFTVAFGEWYHQFHTPLIDKFLSVYNPTGAEPVPDSGLIYFYNGTQFMNGFNDKAKLNFEPNKTYRLRFANIGVFAMWNLWIEGHNMTIVEVDGTEIEPYPAQVLQMSVGQRMSVLVTARNSTDFNFKIHGNMDTKMFDIIPPKLQPNVTSVIEYNSQSPFYKATAADNFENSDFPMVDDLFFVPVEKQSILTNPNVQLPLNVWLGVMDDGINHGQFNNKTYLNAKMPTFLTVHSMGNYSNDNKIYGYNSQVQVLQGGEVVEITVINWDVNSHPFHLHGHKFQVVSRSDTTDPQPPSPTLTNPCRRDVIMVPSRGNVVLRFKADNPGTWLFHCHINWHLKSGLAMQFVENPKAQQAFVIPQELLDQCAEQGIHTKGNGAGNMDPCDMNGESGPVEQIVMGWTPKAITGLFLSSLSAVIGIATVMWFSWKLTTMHKYEKQVN